MPAQPTTAVALAADRAAAVLARGGPGDALQALEWLGAAPEEQVARSPAARWNRALALRDLGLSALAARTFDELAAAGEPGWSGEAQARADELRRPLSTRRDGWTAARTAGHAMVKGGPPIDEALARAHPGISRHYVYHALRTASECERALSLAPLAGVLDAVSGGSVLVDLVAPVSRSDFTVVPVLARDTARSTTPAHPKRPPARGALRSTACREPARPAAGRHPLCPGGAGDRDEFSSLARASNIPGWQRSRPTSGRWR